MIFNQLGPLCYRCHVVDEFNRGIYDYIIATDEASNFQTIKEATKEKKRKTRGKRKRDKEYGVARGIDFKGECFFSEFLLIQLPEVADTLPLITNFVLVYCLIHNSCEAISPNRTIGHVP